MIYTALVSFGGMLGWILTYNNINSSQVLTHTATASIHMLLFVILYHLQYSISNRKTQVAFLASIFCLTAWNFNSSINRIKSDQNLYNSYSDEYLKALEHEVENVKGLKLVASIRNPNGFIEPYTKYSSGNIAGHYLMLFQNDFGFIGIDDLDIPINNQDSLIKRQEINSVSVGSFYQYTKRQKQANVFISKELSQEKFIKEFGFKYLILYKNIPINPLVEKLIVKRIIDQEIRRNFLYTKILKITFFDIRQ